MQLRGTIEFPDALSEEIAGYENDYQVGSVNIGQIEALLLDNEKRLLLIKLPNLSKRFKTLYLKLIQHLYTQILEISYYRFAAIETEQLGKLTGPKHSQSEQGKLFTYNCQNVTDFVHYDVQHSVDHLQGEIAYQRWLLIAYMLFQTKDYSSFCAILKALDSMALSTYAKNVFSQELVKVSNDMHRSFGWSGSMSSGKQLMMGQCVPTLSMFDEHDFTSASKKHDNINSFCHIQERIRCLINDNGYCSNDIFIEDSVLDNCILSCLPKERIALGSIKSRNEMLESIPYRHGIKIDINNLLPQYKEINNLLKNVYESLIKQYNHHLFRFADTIISLESYAAGSYREDKLKPENDISKEKRAHVAQLLAKLGITSEINKKISIIKEALYWDEVVAKKFSQQGDKQIERFHLNKNVAVLLKNLVTMMEKVKLSDELAEYNASLYAELKKLTSPPATQRHSYLSAPIGKNQNHAEELRTNEFTTRPRSTSASSLIYISSTNSLSNLSLACESTSGVSSVSSSFSVAPYLLSFSESPSPGSPLSPSSLSESQELSLSSRSIPIGFVTSARTGSYEDIFADMSSNTDLPSSRRGSLSMPNPVSLFRKSGKKKTNSDPDNVSFPSVNSLNK